MFTKPVFRRWLPAAALLFALAFAVTAIQAATFVTNTTPNPALPGWLDPGYQFDAQSDTGFGESVCVEVHPFGDLGNYVRTQCNFVGGTGPFDWQCDVFTGGIPMAFQNTTIEYQFLVADTDTGCSVFAEAFTGFNWQFMTSPTAVTLSAGEASASASLPAALAAAFGLLLVASLLVLTRRPRPAA